MNARGRLPLKHVQIVAHTTCTNTGKEQCRDVMAFAPNSIHHQMASTTSVMSGDEASG